ncbi:MAG: potassium/proton antiporter [Candidatus Binatia bacterium]
MLIDETAQFTAIALAAGSAMLAVSCLVSGLSRRIGVPVTLLFLGIGMLAGSDGPGGVWFDGFDVAYGCGTTALVIILFSGGLHTRLDELRGAIAPATLLATVGVIGIALLTATGGALLGLPWHEALLVGAIVSSTDAAAVFAVLDGVPLRRRVGSTIELESGLNDPVAVILTLAATANLIGAEPLGWSVLPEMVVQLAIGAAGGALVGGGGRWLLRRAPLSTPALLPTLTLSLAGVAFGLTSIAGGSGFLAVYLTGIAIGNGELPFELNVKRFIESIAWLSQVGMFLLLGLLVFPSKLPAVALPGLLLALYLALVARPLVVTLCLLPFGFAWREIACVALVGLRGAVPIILATVPVLNADEASPALRGALDTFDMVFFVVVVGAFFPGAFVRLVTQRLGLHASVPPLPSASVDIISRHPIQEVQLTMFIDADSPAIGRGLSDLALPADAAVMLIVRGEHLVTPRGSTTFALGDHAFVVCHQDAEAAVRRCFEAPPS